MARAVGRIDDTIARLEELHEVAQGIFDAHIDDMCRQCPGIPWGTLKICEIAAPAGSSMNVIKGLKILREKFTGQPYPGKQCKN